MLVYSTVYFEVVIMALPHSAFVGSERCEQAWGTTGSWCDGGGGGGSSSAIDFAAVCLGTVRAHLHKLVLCVGRCHTKLTFGHEQRIFLVVTAQRIFC
jgi:hypothetical protein